MTELTHASIVPLIGGETIGAERAFGKRPEYLMSYASFAKNDAHLVNYYENEVPYFLIDKGQGPSRKVDVISSVCPCAGLSQFSHGFGDHNPNNEWMGRTTKFVLEDMKPMVLWGENAPGLAGKIGDNVRANLRKIGKENGYTMSIYRTKTLLHGGPQIRERSFFFFWRGDKIPILNWFNKPYKKIEDVLLGVKSNFQQEVINDKTPSIDDVYYRYVLEEIHGGITHREFFDFVEPQSARNSDIFSYIEQMGHDYKRVGAWMAKHGFEKEVEKCNRRYDKLAAGGNIMRRGTIIPKDYIGAFVGHYPTSLTHPYEDRYITYREAMTIMGLPDNFELMNASLKNVNHICQNVPVDTARDMALEVIAAINDEREYVHAEYVLQHNQSQKYDIEGEKSSNLVDFFV